MMDKRNGSLRLLLFISFLFLNSLLYSQMHSGKIVFERKTNLEKKMADIKEPWVDEFISEHKFKKDLFELYFTDSCSIFKPVESDEEDELSWATSKNKTYQNFNSKEQLIVFDMWQQEEFFIKGETSKRNWKITESKRKIGKYECRKAIWQKNDSTRLYAWFTNEILTPIGPEGFSGLPGTILGIATEDGGIIYFAKSVEFIDVDPDVFKIEAKKKSYITLEEFQLKIDEKLAENQWGKLLVKDLFRWM